MSFLAFVGRLMFSFLFLSSGLQKLQTFNLNDGGVAMTIMKPRMDEAQRSFKQLTKIVIDKFQLPVEHKEILPYLTLPTQYYPHALGVAIFLEVAGSLLFVLNRPIGAWMLALFLVTVTPIMHDFWTLPDDSPERFNDMVNFFKNMALLGAMFFFIGGRPRRGTA